MSWISLSFSLSLAYFKSGRDYPYWQAIKASSTHGNNNFCCLRGTSLCRDSACRECEISLAIVGFCRTFLVGGKDEEEWTWLYNPKGHAILPLLILEKGALSCQAAYWPLRLSLSSLMETEHERCFAIRRQVWKRVKRNKGKGNETKKKTSEKGAVCARVFPSLISFFKPVTHVLLKGRSPDAGPGGRQLEVNERVFYMRSSPYVKGAGGLLLQNEWVSSGHRFFFKVRTYFKTILF